MASFNFIEQIPGVTHGNLHIVTAGIVSVAMIMLGVAARVALGNGQSAIIPAKKFSMKGFFEQLTGFIDGLVVSVVGDKGKAFTPMFAAIFFFIFMNNLFGLLPGMAPATENMNTSLAVGIFSFLVYNYYGFKEHGFAYLKQFLGPVLALAPLMLVIELISHLVRPMSLGLRLQGNMMGDHLVLSVFTNLVPFGVPIPFYMLGIFVCFMQAFVFTILSMIYISMAMSHDH